ncbi:MAG: tetratricopeptide repeat protein [bacterium]|nr:tetratricopeptide repeat protein [bacterium]
MMELADEKRQLARQNYRLASHYMSSTTRDYAPAVDLLQEATRLDPKPEYFALLAQAQAKNPNWYLDAVESYRQAVRLSPKDAGIRVGFATLLEGAGDIEGARAEYQAALDTMPDHPTAQEGLERLGSGQISEGLRSLFRGRS